MRHSAHLSMYHRLCAPFMVTAAGILMTLLDCDSNSAFRLWLLLQQFKLTVSFDVLALNAFATDCTYMVLAWWRLRLFAVSGHSRLTS